MWVLCQSIRSVDPTNKREEQKIKMKTRSGFLLFLLFLFFSSGVYWYSSWERAAQSEMGLVKKPGSMFKKIGPTETSSLYFS